MITTNDKRKINKMCPIARITAIGDNIIGAPIIIKIAVTADGTGGISTTVPIAMEITGMDVVATAANAAATATLSDGTDNISDAVICAVLDTVISATTLDDTFRTLAKDDTLEITTNGAADRCVAYIHGFRA